MVGSQRIAVCSNGWIVNRSSGIFLVEGGQSIMVSALGVHGQEENGGDIWSPVGQIYAVVCRVKSELHVGLRRAGRRRGAD